MEDEEIKQSTLHFFRKYGFPGIIDCVDGTHIKIIKPSINGIDYLNRKGYYSINAMIVTFYCCIFFLFQNFIHINSLQVCDYNMKIRAVDACHCGASHDALIWNMSEAKQYFAEKFS